MTFYNAGVCTYTYANMYTHTHCTCICVYIHTYIRTHIQIVSHTYTQTPYLLALFCSMGILVMKKMPQVWKAQSQVLNILQIVTTAIITIIIIIIIITTTTTMVTITMAINTVVTPQPTVRQLTLLVMQPPVVAIWMI